MTAPNIQGTYQLVRRELPDGTVQRPPAVNGMFSITEEFRNFSVLWQDREGELHSRCYVARYTLTETEYSEISGYLVATDQGQGRQVSYDLSKVTASSAVTTEDGRIRFALPQPFERETSVTVEFEGDAMKATAGDLFVDYWQRVT